MIERLKKVGIVIVFMPVILAYMAVLLALIISLPVIVLVSPDKFKITKSVPHLV